MNSTSFVFGLLSALGLGSLIGMAINERLHQRTQEKMERIKKNAEEERWRSRVNVDLRTIKERLGIPEDDRK